MPPARPQRQYDETYVGYPDNDFKRNYNGYNYPSRNERARFDPPPEQQPPGDDFMPIKVEPQEQLGPREILMPNRPVPVVANPQPVLQSLQSRPPPVAQPVSLIGREHARKQPTLQSNSQVVSAPTNMPPNEFNFNLAAAKQRVEAMQSTGFMGNKVCRIEMVIHVLFAECHESRILCMSVCASVCLLSHLSVCMLYVSVY